MDLGISIYFSLDNTNKENVYLMKLANKYGFNKIFTSLHIPEANYFKLKNEVHYFLNEAKKYDMDIIADIFPNTFKFLNLNNMDILSLKKLGFTTLRLDFGYTEDEISTISRNKYGVKV